MKVLSITSILDFIKEPKLKMLDYEDTTDLNEALNDSVAAKAPKIDALAGQCL